MITIGETIGGPEVRQLFDRCIAGKERIPLEEFFERAGLRLVLDAQAAWVRSLPHAPASARHIRDGIVGVSTQHDHAALQEHIELALNAFDCDSRPGAVVVVTRDGHVIAEHAVGMANLEHSVPLTTDSVFHVASDAKRFTAAAICRLVERGQLRLEDPVATHLPETAPLGEQLTIEQLLCHTSGIKDQWSLLAMAGWRPEDVVTHDQVMDLLCRQQSTNFQAGDRQMYSNSGYTLLAEIVLQVTGSELGTFLDREFFVPSAMSRTHVRASVAEIVPGRVESYLRSPTGKYVRRPVQYEVLGATSLLTTARDLARWIEAVHAGQALSPFELETMLKTRWLPNGDEMTYALGLFEHDLHGFAAVGHGGADGGFRSYFVRIPEARLGIVVLANTPEIEPNGLAHQIAEWALGIESEPTESRGPGEPARLDVAAFVGTYRDDDGEMVTVRRWFDELRLWEGVENPGTFSWCANEEVYADANGRVLEFEEERCRLTSEKETWIGSRVPHPSTEELRAYEGLYHSEELDALFNVRVENQMLIARSPRGTTITLTPAGRDFFDGDTWYCFEIRFTRAASGRVQTMHLSSSRAFDVPFKRRPPG